MGFKACVKYFTRKSHKKFQGCFKNLSMKFCFAILCMNLIAATRAEGGLVFMTSNFLHFDVTISWCGLEADIFLARVFIEHSDNPLSRHQTILH